MNENRSKGGIGFIGLLGLAFIVLRLCGVINWSWVWVLCPIWGSFAVVLLIFIAVVLYKIIKQIRGSR